MRERTVDGDALQLVTVCPFDGSGEVSDGSGEPVPPRSPVVSCLLSSEARELAFELLELAERAERRTGERE